MIYLSEPLFSERPWGDPELNKLYGVNSELPIGEVWLLCDFLDKRTPLKDSCKTVFPMDLVSDFCDKPLPRFPLLIKLISAKDWLSVQVHPDDVLARKLEKEPWGKTEAWYFISDGTIAAGFSDPEIVNKKDISEIKAEDLNILDVHKGELIKLPAGMVHALGPNTRLLEIQQASDLTYRIYDWDRPRELHLEKARLAIKPSLTPKIEALKDFETRDMGIFKLTLTNKASGKGIFVTLEEKPRDYVVVDDSLETKKIGLWIEPGEYWKGVSYEV